MSGGIGMLIMSGLLSFMWAMGVLAASLGKRQSAKQDQKRLEKTNEEHIRQLYKPGFTRDAALWVSRMDHAIDSATAPPSEFVGLCKCPKCGVFAWHHINRYTKKHVERRCVSDQCNKKWKQIR